MLINAILLNGILLWVFPSAAMATLGCCVGTFCALTIYFAMMRGWLSLRTSHLWAASLLFGYCGGAMMSIISFALRGFNVFDLADNNVQYDCYAFMLVMLGSGVLLLAGYLEPPLLQSFRAEQMSVRQERFIWIAIAIMLFAYATGSLKFSGTLAVQQSAEGSNSTIASIATMQMLGCVPLGLVATLQSTGHRRIRLLLMSMLCILLMLPMGRRMLLYTVMIGAFAVFHYSGFVWRASPLSKFLTISAISAVLLVTLVAFMGIRLAAGQLGRNSSGQLSEIAPRVLDYFANNREAVVANTSSNIEMRGFIISYLAMLSKGGHSESPLWGQDLQQAIYMSVPDSFMKISGNSKDQVRSLGGEEGLANEHFGLTVSDEANSVLTGGYIDFAEIGVIVYPLLVVLCARFLLMLGRRFLNAEGDFYLSISVASFFLTTESSLDDIVSGLRAIFILTVLWKFFYTLPHIAVMRRKKGLLARQWTHAGQVTHS